MTPPGFGPTDFRNLVACRLRIQARKRPMLEPPLSVSPEIVIPSASLSEEKLLSRVPVGHPWSFCLRVSGAVAPSAPHRSGFSHRCVGVIIGSDRGLTKRECRKHHHFFLFFPNAL